MEKHYKQLYESLLETKQLKMFFPKMSGDWEKDQKRFIKEQQELENIAGYYDVEESDKSVNKMYEGFFETCKIVSKSMGAEGAFGIIRDRSELHAPIATKDGVSICRNVFFDDFYKAIGAYYAKQATARTLAKAGDSTTLTLVLANAIVKEGRNKFNSRFKEGVFAAEKEIAEILETVKEDMTDQNMKSVAKISANNDEEIADLVVKAYQTVGLEGVVNVQEDNDSTSSSLIISEGMRLEKGWKSPFLSNPDTGVHKAEKVKVLVYEGNIIPESVQKVEEFINENAKEPLFIICEMISDDIIAKLEGIYTWDADKKRGVNICVIESPFYGEQRKAVLKDIALYTGGEVFIQGVSQEFKIGYADKIIIDQDTTSIIQSEVSQGVKDIAASLKVQLETTSEKDFFNKRISQLEGKAAIIKVGGVTDVSRKEIFDRVEDSVCAVKSAVAEGIVSGGGSALVYVNSSMTKKFENDDVQAGYETVKKALLSPYKTIMKNADVNPKEYIGKSKEYGVGYNLKSNAIENLIDSGVVDSVRSIKVALQNAISVSVTLLNTKMIVG